MSVSTEVVIVSDDLVAVTVVVVGDVLIQHQKSCSSKCIESTYIAVVWVTVTVLVATVEMTAEPPTVTETVLTGAGNLLEQ